MPSYMKCRRDCRKRLSHSIDRTIFCIDSTKTLENKASVKVRQLIENKLFVKDLGMLSTKYQTSNLEAFYSLIIHFAIPVFN